jgi:hypothetical protein
MTKVTAKYYVFRDKEQGEFLESYKDRGCLAFRNSYTDKIQNALTMSEEGYEQQKKEMKNLAKAFGAEIIEVNATFELSYPNGDEVREIENKEDHDEFKSLLKTILSKSILGNGEENDF